MVTKIFYLKLVIIIAVLFNSSIIEARKNYTVHLVCHSHTDIGWIRTLDQYFYKMNVDGTLSTINSVNLIITTVIDSLLSNE